MKLTKTILKAIETDPTLYADTTSETKLENTLRALSDAYYNTDKPLITDELFDVLKNKLKQKNPDNDFIHEVGAPVDKNDETKLPFPMGSLDKIKPDTNALENWMKLYKGDYVVSDKLDGLSCQIHIKNNTVKLYTRGNGKVGKDVTHLLSYLAIDNKHLEKLKKLETEISLRGELIIKKSDFGQIKDKKNIRNTVAGLVNSKRTDKRLANLTHLVLYSVLYPRMTYEKQMEFLKNTKLDVVDYNIYDDLTNDTLNEKLIERKKKSEYDIDGLVVFDSSKVYQHEEGIPEYGFAFKSQITMESAEAIVIDVIWDISMDGFLKPRVKIEEVNLAGVSINYATAFHAKFVEDNKLGVGAVIKIIRSGDVIPHIVEIVKEAKKTKMPDIKYEWDKTHTNIIATDIKDEYLTTIQAKRMDYFFSTIGIKHLSIGIVTKFVEGGFTNIIELLKTDRKKLTKLDGLGEKSIKKIFDQIDDVMTSVPLSDLMTGSHVWGNGIAEKRIKLIIKNIPNMLSMDSNELRDSIMEIDGFSDLTTDKFIDGLDDFKEFYKQLKKIYPLTHLDVKKDEKKDEKNNNVQSMNEQKVVISEKNNNSLFMNEQKVVMTGFRNANFEKFIENNGGKVVGSVSKNTTLVIYKDINENSSKLTKAKELNIKLMSYDEFEKIAK